MKCLQAVLIAVLAIVASPVGLLLTSPDANAQPMPNPIPAPPGPQQLPSGGGGSSGGGGGAELGPGGGTLGVQGLGITLPYAPAIFLCPGVGAAGGSVGAGGGYCDFSFLPVQLTPTTYGVGHIHCEWGGISPIVSVWNCWRVFPGQPDHPAHPDPDIIPDGWGVPWAIQGPAPSDQFPPPGLAPGRELLAPPEPEGPLPGPPPGPPPPAGLPLPPGSTGLFGPGEPPNVKPPPQPGLPGEPPGPGP